MPPHRQRTPLAPPPQGGGPFGGTYPQRPLGLGALPDYLRRHHASGTIRPFRFASFLGRESTQVLAYQGGAYIRTVGRANKSVTL